MALSKISTNRLSPMRKGRRKKGISSIISTVIITAALLIILVIASFVATNILGLQMADSEFQQAQSNMLLLDSVIQDVSLRQGAGSYVQFNQITGGIGIAKDTTSTLTITGPSGHTYPSTTEPHNSLYSLVYTGGTSMSGASQDLKGSNSLSITLQQPIGYLRVETGNGLKIKLDYNRVRVVNMSQQWIGSVPYEFYEITFLQLTQGSTTGSGNVRVMAQNVGITNIPWTFTGTSGVITATLKSTDPPTTLLSMSSTKNYAVLITIVTIQISIA